MKLSSRRASKYILAELSLSWLMPCLTFAKHLMSDDYSHMKNQFLKLCFKFLNYKYTLHSVNGSMLKFKFEFKVYKLGLCLISHEYRNRN